MFGNKKRDRLIADLQQALKDLTETVDSRAEQLEDKITEDVDYLERQFEQLEPGLSQDDLESHLSNEGYVTEREMETYVKDEVQELNEDIEEKMLPREEFDDIMDLLIREAYPDSFEEVK